MELDDIRKLIELMEEKGVIELELKDADVDGLGFLSAVDVTCA